jgi:hypothetical protein
MKIEKEEEKVMDDSLDFLEFASHLLHIPRMSFPNGKQTNSATSCHREREREREE